MSEKPEALRLADDLDAYHTRSCHKVAAAELRRLHAENERLQARYEACDKVLRQWLDKTKWIQETKRGCELGMHLADAVRQRLSAVEAQRDALLASLRVAVDSDLGRAWVWPDTAREQWMRDARAAIKAVEGEDK